MLSLKTAAAALNDSDARTYSPGPGVVHIEHVALETDRFDQPCHAIGQVLEGVGETPGSGASDAAFACSRARRPDHGSSSRTPTPKSRGSSACFPRSRRSGRNGRARPRHRRPCGSARSAVHQGCALRVTADIGTSPEMKMSAENSACSQKCSLLRSQFFCGSG